MNDKIKKERKQVSVSLSPLLLHQFNISNSIVVIIDILRATSTMVTMLQYGAKYIIPVDDVMECKKIADNIKGLAVGERDGAIVPGFQFPNSPLTFTNKNTANKILVLTTTNGTKLLYQAHNLKAQQIIIGAFLNLNAVIKYLIHQNKNVVLACAAWQDKVNIEDTLFAGAVVNKLKKHFDMKCDSAMLAEQLFLSIKDDFNPILSNVTHYKRLAAMGQQKDLDFCFKKNKFSIVPIFDGKKIIIAKH